MHLGPKTTWSPPRWPESAARIHSQQLLTPTSCLRKGLDKSRSLAYSPSKSSRQTQRTGRRAAGKAEGMPTWGGNGGIWQPWPPHSQGLWEARAGGPCAVLSKTQGCRAWTAQHMLWAQLSHPLHKEHWPLRWQKLGLPEKCPLGLRVKMLTQTSRRWWQGIQRKPPTKQRCGWGEKQGPEWILSSEHLRTFEGFRTLLQR